MSKQRRITTFSNDGLEFDVRDDGPLDGDIVILLHGWPQTAKCWEAVSQRLNAAGYRTLRPDQRGYSPRARPPQVSAYRMPRLVGDIMALIEATGSGPVHLVGHDWGAAVAWALAAQHPQALRTLTSVSVPHAGAFLRAMLSSDQLRRSWYMGLFQLPLLPELLATRYQGVLKKLLADSGMTAAGVESVFADVVAAGAFPTSLNWYRAMPYTSPRSLSLTVPVPVMHIWGDRETALSRRSAELAGRFATGPFRLEIVAGGTHWLPEQMPDEVAALIIESLRAGA